MHLGDFELAGKESRVASRQFISHLDGEIHWAGVSNSPVLAERVTPAAIFNLPPMTRTDLFGLAIEFPRHTAGRGKLCVDLTAAGDWSIDAQIQSRHPAKNLEILFVRTEREGGDLHGVFLNRRLILRVCFRS